MVDKIVQLLEKKHGKKLDIKNDVYYLFLKDCVVMVYYNEDEKSIKFDVEMLPENDTYVYLDDEKLENII